MVTTLSEGADRIRRGLDARRYLDRLFSHDIGLAADFLEVVREIDGCENYFRLGFGVFGVYRRPSRKQKRFMRDFLESMFPRSIGERSLDWFEGHGA